mmetsp:Transcript_12163/g.29058  ORF Transcript_12163/g.29058 Transcript_12163/m.29058 type:complete len:217 (+) Transcript_12163:276-926(+)
MKLILRGRCRADPMLPHHWRQSLPGPIEEESCLLDLAQAVVELFQVFSGHIRDLQHGSPGRLEERNAAAQRLDLGVARSVADHLHANVGQEQLDVLVGEDLLLLTAHGSWPHQLELPPCRKQLFEMVSAYSPELADDNRNGFMGKICFFQLLPEVLYFHIRPQDVGKAVKLFPRLVDLVLHLHQALAIVDTEFVVVVRREADLHVTLPVLVTVLLA